MGISETLKSYILNKGFDVDECILYLLARRHRLKCKISEEAFRFLQLENFIQLDFASNEIIPTIGIYENEQVNLPEIDFSIEQIIKERVDEYRQLFKGIRTGSIGVKSKVVELLTQFCLQNNVTFDEVLEATKIYMSYTDFHLISNADNFISKLDKSGQEVSLLKLALEEQSMTNHSESRTYKVI